MERKNRIFVIVWRLANLLLLAAVAALFYASVWEFSVRSYLHGFSNAIVPIEASPEQRVELILAWMKTGPAHSALPTPAGVSQRDPSVTLNYEELLKVCGTATNAFLNLAKSSGLEARRLLLLTPDRATKHVVAEVLIGGRWVVVDPSFKAVFRDAAGGLLTRQELRNPLTWQQATSPIPGYPREYTYENFAHVHLSRIPWLGKSLRRVLEFIFPRWEELIDWSLILERESFAMLLLSIFAVAALLVLRVMLGRYADRRLNVARFHLRQLFSTGRALLSRPETR